MPGRQIIIRRPSYFRPILPDDDEGQRRSRVLVCTQGLLTVLPGNISAAHQNRQDRPTGGVLADVHSPRDPDAAIDDDDRGLDLDMAARALQDGRTCKGNETLLRQEHLRYLGRRSSHFKPWITATPIFTQACRDSTYERDTSVLSRPHRPAHPSTFERCLFCPRRCTARWSRPRCRESWVVNYNGEPAASFLSPRGPR
ncbi:hypothetical protein C8R46DRAFT_514511 [Mycena filopes]|nr:hypothetical protein C8R46DRAFT_514511 [Mycena filopes]